MNEQCNRPLSVDEKFKLRSCATEAEWTAECRSIRETRGGQEPEDWYCQVLSKPDEYPALSRMVLSEHGRQP